MRTRKVRMGLACAVALLTTACYESEHQLFSTKGGVKMPLASGVYDCVDGDNKPSDPLQVTPSERNGTYIYIIRYPSKGGPDDTADLSFHKMSGKRYLVVTRQIEGGKDSKGQGIGILQLDGNVFKWLAMDPDREAAVGKKTGGYDGSYKLVGTLDQQRAFVRAMALEKEESVTMACQLRTKK
jgi:hypothetical protein